MRKKFVLKGIIPFVAGCLFSVSAIAQEGKLPVRDIDATNVQEPAKMPMKSVASKVIQPTANKVASTGLDVLVNNNNGAIATGRFTQSETTLIAWGSNVVVGYNDAGSIAAGSHFTGWSYSSDGGVTFTDGGNLPNSAVGDAGDPLLARNAATGRIYFVTLGFNDPPATMQMFHSDDNGITWSAPVNCTPGGDDEDKPWMVVDNYPGTGNGTVYLMSRRFGGAVASQGLYLFKSTDNGATFGPSGGTLIASGASFNVQGAFLVIAPDHTVHAIYFDDGANNIKIRKSTDLGATFSAPVVIVGGLPAGTNGDLGLAGIRQGTATPSGFRSSAFPHAAGNPLNSNILYVVYNNKPAGTDKADVYMVMSTDAGATWGAPVRVNDDATTTDQWQPTIAVMDNGTSLGVFYYSRQEDPVNNNLFRYYGRIGNISGNTVVFDPSFAISDVASLPEFGRDAVVNSVYMGDYNQAIGVSGVYHLSWADNRSDLAIGPPRKDPNVYYDKVTVVPPQISVNPTSLTINVAYGGTGSTTFDISNTVADAATLVWSISTGGCPWISSVVPASGNTAGGASTTVTVNVNAAGQTCGPHNCTLTVTSNASNTPSLTIPVQLNVGSTISCSIVSVPENNIYTGGNPRNIYLGYGPQKTTLQSSVVGTGPFTYSWSPSTGLSSATSAAPVFTPTGAGTYLFTLTVTGPGGCQTTCSITINVYDIRVPGTNGKKIYLCHAPPDNPSNVQSLQLSVNAVPGHMPAHPDDHLGPCSLNIAPRGVEFDVIAAGPGIQAFPNPNKGKFELQLDNFSSGKAEIRVMNIDGTIVERKSVSISAGSQVIGIDMKNKAAGMYYVQVVTADGIQNAKFVISR